MSRYAGTSFTLSQMTAGRTLTWLRCGSGGGVNDPSTAWVIPTESGEGRAPLYRELVILNHRNEFLQSFDLASQPIDGVLHAAQRAVVREALRAAALLPDIDADALPDAWELDEFGSLTAVTAETPTASGLTALLAYGSGQSPHAATAGRGLWMTQEGGLLRLQYTRRLDRRPALIWQLETSAQLTGWLAWPDLVGPTRTTRYDGSGTEVVTHRVGAGGEPVPAAAFRLTLRVGSEGGG